MRYVLGFIIGTILGMVIVASASIDEINDLTEESTNAETRAVIHFRKLFKIENIIKTEEKNKTPAVFIVDKIKEVISSDQTN